jgi:hypothetical protein
MLTLHLGAAGSKAAGAKGSAAAAFPATTATATATAAAGSSSSASSSAANGSGGIAVQGAPIGLEEATNTAAAQASYAAQRADALVAELHQLAIE